MCLNIIPLYDKILIKKLENKENKTPQGIILPEDKNDTSLMYKVLEVGEGRLTPEGKIIPLKVKVGDVISAASYAGLKMGDDCSLISESEVLGISR